MCLTLSKGVRYALSEKAKEQIERHKPYLLRWGIIGIGMFVAAGIDE